MSRRIKNHFSVLMICAAVLLPATYFAQTKLDITAGYSLPEEINFGIRLDVNSYFLLGITVGSFPSNSYDIFTGGLDAYIMFGQESKKTRRPPWYIRGSFVYANKNASIVSYNRFYAVGRFGREFSLGRYWGMNIDIGGSYVIYNIEKVTNAPSGWDGEEKTTFEPAGSIMFFYKI